MRSARFLGRPPKRYEWLGGNSLLGSVAIGGTSNQPLVSDAEELSDLTNPTIIRVRGHLHLQVNALVGQVYWAAGLIMIETNAVIAGAWPDPITDQDADWFWHASGLLFDFGGGQRYVNHVIDSKAMRKIDADQYSPQLILSSSSASTGAMGYNFSARSLWQQV